VTLLPVWAMALAWCDKYLPLKRSGYISIAWDTIIFPFIVTYSEKYKNHK
jgi:hypothetical protein